MRTRSVKRNRSVRDEEEDIADKQLAVGHFNPYHDLREKLIALLGYPRRKSLSSTKLRAPPIVRKSSKRQTKAKSDL
jgi:hypothetical protein